MSHLKAFRLDFTQKFLLEDNVETASKTAVIECMTYIDRISSESFSWFLTGKFGENWSLNLVIPPVVLEYFDILENMLICIQIASINST